MKKVIIGLLVSFIIYELYLYQKKIKNKNEWKKNRIEEEKTDRHTCGKESFVFNRKTKTNGSTLVEKYQFVFNFLFYFNQYKIFIFETIRNSFEQIKNYINVTKSSDCYFDNKHSRHFFF